MSVHVSMHAARRLRALGNYPDVFAAGSAFMGVPFGCFATTDGSGWNSACANGRIIRTPQEWGDPVRAAHPGYSGPRPRVQLWHGTEDSTLRHPNLGEEIKQWTDVLGVSRTPAFTDQPQGNWTRTRYGGTGTEAPVEANSLQGVGHSLPLAGMARRAIEFFGLNGSTPPGGETGACRVTYSATVWDSGLTASLTLTNTGSSPVDGWSLRFTLPPGTAITSGWNAGCTASGGAVTATNAPHNRVIAPGASVALGYQATHTGGTAPPPSFTLNGNACATG